MWGVGSGYLQTESRQDTSVAADFLGASSVHAASGTLNRYNACTTVVQGLYDGCTRDAHRNSALAMPEQCRSNAGATRYLRALRRGTSRGAAGLCGWPWRASVRLKNLVAGASNEANTAQHHARPTESSPIPQSNLGRRADGAASPPLRP